MASINQTIFIPSALNLWRVYKTRLHPIKCAVIIEAVVLGYFKKSFLFISFSPYISQEIAMYEKSMKE